MIRAPRITSRTKMGQQRQVDSAIEPAPIGVPRTGDASVNIGRDAVGNVITTGDRNKIDAKIEAKLVRTGLPTAAEVDVSSELAQIRAILQGMGGEHAGKIGRALDDAVEESQKPKPSRDEIGSALRRALGYAKGGADFAEEVDKLAPHLTSAVAWLGSNWHQLLSAIGLTV